MDTQDLPYGKPFLFKMINYDLDYNLDPNNYELGPPTFTLGFFNTTVEIKPYLKTSLYGRFYYKYNRFNLNDLDSTLKVTVNNETSLVDLLPKINQLELFDTTKLSPLTFIKQLNVPYIGDSEILNKTLPPFGSFKETFTTIVARPNSYLLSGLAELKLLKY